MIKFLNPSTIEGALIIGIIAGLISGIILGFFTGKTYESNRKSKSSTIGKDNITIQNSKIGND